MEPDAALSNGGWETFPHGSDIGIRGRAPTLEGAFERAALALTGVITEPERVRPLVEVDLACVAEDPELLFLDWVNALVYEMDVRGMLFARFEVAIGHGALRGRAYGEPVDRIRHHPAVEVKGATLAELCVAQEPGGWWRAQCVVDV